MFKSEKKSAAREEIREQNRRQVELISNAFSEKRKGLNRLPLRHPERQSRDPAAKALR
jgi:hypothetical protein